MSECVIFQIVFDIKNLRDLEMERPDHLFVFDHKGNDYRQLDSIGQTFSHWAFYRYEVRSRSEWHAITFQTHRWLLNSKKYYNVTQ
jgi:hypothetical protein